jgi:hypothetical protein
VTGDRCPHCSAALPAAATWCSLCYADLRPAPSPDPLTAPIGVLVGAELPLAPAAVAAGVDPLNAPLDVLVGAVPPAPGAGAGAATEPDRPRATWPCARCQGRTPIEETACAGCGAPFGTGLSDGGRELPGTRSSRLIAAFAFLVVVLVVVGVASWVMTPTPEPADKKEPVVVVVP